jgi:multiple sugar transport system ATP-binding protein
MASVTVSGVDKSYGPVRVIEGLDLEIRDQEFMVLVGPSGCGKSTLLRMVAGLEEITGGEISIGDRVVNDVPPKDRDIAMVFQNYALYPHMSVRENLEFGLRIRKMARAEIDERVAEAARILGIDTLLDRKPKQLSGGQRQRVAVGRAIVRKPSVFLFDEPLSNLDAKLRVQMRAEISSLQRRLKTTTIYVTHDQVEAMTMGHRMAIMKDGELQQVGTPLEVYDSPANVFVAQFIGTPPMNLLPARIDESGAALEVAGARLPVPDSLRAVAGLRAGKPAILGVRPENVYSSSKAASGASGRITVEVELVEPLGHEVVLHGRLGELTIVSKLEPHFVPEPGSRVELSIELDAVHLFDSDTEQRLVT